jgi:hypothetical protein
MARRPKKYANTFAKAERKRANRKLGAEFEAARKRAKYGPSGKPAPVIVKRLGDV